MTLFLHFENWLRDQWGYIAVVHFEDIMLFLTGVFLGSLIVTYLGGRAIYLMKKHDGLGRGKFKLYRHTDNDGKRHYLVDPQSIGEGMETLLLMIFQNIFPSKSYTIRDERRTRKFIIVIIIVGAIVSFLAFLSINTVLFP